jgi:VCBS repeat-containing protein
VPVAARPEKSKAAAAIASPTMIPHKVSRPKSKGKKGVLFLGLVILVAIVIWKIAPTMVNHRPVGDHVSVTTQEDTEVPIILTATDRDGDELSYRVTKGPSHGRITGVPPGLTYAPESDYNGPDSFTFIVNDGRVDSNPATISITVEAVNDAPSAEAQSVTTAEDTPVLITLIGNDRDADPLTYAVVTGPAHGTLSGVAPDLKYTPSADFAGSDGFIFAVNDGSLDSEPATVSITVTPVNDSPVAKDQDVTTLEDKPVTIDVLRASFDANNDSLTVAAVTQGAHGSVSINEDGTLTYTPNANFYGTDAFTYTISDGKGGTNTATVNVTVTAVNDPPKITSTPRGRVVAAVPYTYQIEAVDPDGQDSLTYLLITGPAGMSIDSSCGLIGWNPSTAQIGSHDVIVKVVDNSSGQASDTQLFSIMVESVPPKRAILTITDGYDQKRQRTLSTQNKTYVVQSSDGQCWETDPGSYTSYDFSDESIPAGATITLVEIWVQHFEQEQFPLGKLQWCIGTGWPSKAVVWVSLDAPVRAGKANKATEAWNVTSVLNSPERINSLQLQVKNNSATAEGKTLVDYIYAVVEWH